MSTILHVGVLGASGYAGAELLRILDGHPGFEVVYAGGSSQVGTRVGSLYPSLALAYPDMMIQPTDQVPSGLDLVFLALPHGVSQDLVPHIEAGLVVDLSSDFRFSGEFRFGLVELFREELVGAKAIAVPGCYVTTAALTVAPLLKGGFALSTGIVVDAASGVTGAGREPKTETMFATLAESFTAYGLLNHRHTPEMEMALSRHLGDEVEILFTPHLAPMNRGILATCYLRPTGEHSTEELLTAMVETYKTEPFIEVAERIPTTKATLGSNSVHITVRRDQRTGWIVALGALDNLMKGASGQAVQCANVALRLEETTGLSTVGVYP